MVEELRLIIMEPKHGKPAYWTWCLPLANDRVHSLERLNALCAGPSVLVDLLAFDWRVLFESSQLSSR